MVAAREVSFAWSTGRVVVPKWSSCPEADIGSVRVEMFRANRSAAFGLSNRHGRRVQKSGTKSEEWRQGVDGDVQLSEKVKPAALGTMGPQQVRSVHRADAAVSGGLGSPLRRYCSRSRSTTNGFNMDTGLVTAPMAAGAVTKCW